MRLPRLAHPLGAGVSLLGVLLACKLPGGSPAGAGEDATATSPASTGAVPELATVPGITAHADRLDCAVGKGTVRVTEAHNTEGMGSSVIIFEIDDRIVKIVRRTELAPPTVITAFYFVDGALVLADTRIRDTIDGAPLPAPDRRYYAAGNLLGREGRPASDGDPDAERAREDHVVAQALLAGARERLPDVRLPAGVW
ncbi:MAG TPA: hypothetical protein PLU22_12310 [Polyangiaceae bacterium]|nr:hypothetical protein [Polyangiaceae bacterium]